MGSRNKGSKNDWRRYRKFEQENERLRKEVSKLRKVINKVVVDQLEERVRKVDNGGDPILRACDVCGNDELHSVPINRPDGSFEIRICASCGHRSQLKKKEQKK